MKILQMLKKAGGIAALAIVLESCSNALPPFALTKGITENRQNDSISGGNNNNSTNNTNSSDEKDKPDLVAVSLEPGIGMPVAGKWEVWEAETYKDGVIATIKNAGAADITTLFKVGVYMRYNNPAMYYDWALPSLKDGMRIGTVDVIGLKVGETKKIPITITIPNDAFIGKNNYIGLWVDYDDNISESDDGNNKGGYNKAVNEYQLGGDALHLLHVHENRPDIVALSFSPPSSLKKGVQNSASVTIKNTGHRDVLGLFAVGVYVSNYLPGIYYGKRIGATEVTGLKVGETKTLSLDLLLNGTYSNVHLNETLYIGVMVDCNNNIKEMERERKGDGDYNKGGYNGNTNSYEPGALLKTVYYSN